jgi:hypothetical protein
MISWYSIDGNLSIVEQGAVIREDAMRIIEDYSKRADATYERGEGALAATMFGFQKSKAEFVEICFNSTDEISFTYEHSVPRKHLFLSVPKITRKEKTLRRVEDVKAAVFSFYEMDAHSFQRLLDA